MRFSLYLLTRRYTPTAQRSPWGFGWSEFEDLALTYWFWANFYWDREYASLLTAILLVLWGFRNLLKLDSEPLVSRKSSVKQGNQLIPYHRSWSGHLSKSCCKNSLWWQWGEIRVQALSPQRRDRTVYIQSQSWRTRPAELQISYLEGSEPIVTG